MMHVISFVMFWLLLCYEIFCSMISFCNVCICIILSFVLFCFYFVFFLLDHVSLCSKEPTESEIDKAHVRRMYLTKIKKRYEEAKAKYVFESARTEMSIACLLFS
jgi:hypothetical protein